jgi:hypothetical protein
MKTLEFTISDEAWELLKKLEKSSLEYRDPEYQTLEDFKKSTTYLDGTKDEQWFLNRNSEGSLYLIDELGYCGLVESDGDSWHMTYILTPFGKEMAKNLNRQHNLKTLGI